MSASPEQHRGGRASTLGRDLTLYLLARFGLIAIVAVILVFLRIPLIMALAGGFIVAIPLGFLVLRPLNRRVSAGLAVRRERRERQRAELRAQLRGDTGTDAGQQQPGVPGEAERGEDSDETRDEDSQ